MTEAHHVAQQADNSESSDTGENWLVATSVLTTLSSKDSVLLTRKVWVRGPKTKTHVVCFLDNGSQACFIAQDLAVRLGLRQVGRQVLSVGTILSAEGQPIACDVYEFDLVLNDGNSITVRAFARDKLMNKVVSYCVEPYEKDGKKWRITRHRVLPELLLGVDVCYSLKMKPVAALKCGAEILSSEVGFFMGGPVENPSEESLAVIEDYVKDKHGCPTVQSHPILKANLSVAKHEPSVLENVEQMWSLDTVGISETEAVAKDDVIAERKVLESLKFVDGHYEVKWPWIEENPQLATHYGISLRRLEGVHKQLLQKPEILKKICRDFKGPRSQESYREST